MLKGDFLCHNAAWTSLKSHYCIELYRLWKLVHCHQPKDRISYVKHGQLAKSKTKSNIYNAKVIRCIWWYHKNVLYDELLKSGHKKLAVLHKFAKRLERSLLTIGNILNIVFIHLTLKPSLQIISVHPIL